ncbi:MAG TPA: PDZ domain-containing protein [Candidatus Acidoferrum sp.]|nr:PDZ domain-containing protein [Candidatus Acidoferrum sp.]
MLLPRRLIHASTLVALLFFVASSIVAGPAPLRYQLRFERPNTHLMDITVQADALKGATADFAMPDWAPGAYGIENYAANVQRFLAHSADGRELSWRKTDSQTWHIELGGATAVTIDYQVYANNLQNNVGQYDDRHAFIAGPATWMYLVGGKERPIELSIDIPSGWKVATGMEHASDHTFRAENYDWFADTPVEISDFTEKDFVVLGSTYHIIFHDVMGGKDTSQFTADLQKIVGAIVPIFQPVAGSGTQAAPFKDYYFLFHVWPKAGGGLEHLNSTQINFSKDMDNTEPVPARGTQYTSKLYVSAHEFFHAWNVKRIRPRPLGPFDYSQMVHTPSLWISEGLTSYYGWLALAHAGLITPQQYLDYIARLITEFEKLPGRTERSIEDTSSDTWFFGLRTIGQDTNLANTSYSYYDGGQIIGHILDFAIRQDTNNQKSLDDWMRLLYTRYALPKPGFEPDDAVHVASEIAGQDVSDIFRRYISGKEPIPYEPYFAYAGVAAEKKLDASKSWAGLTFTKQDNGTTTIKNVIPGGPAESAGLDKDDLIIALDGRALSSTDDVEALISAYKPGVTMRVLVQRLGQMREFPLTLAPNPYYTYTLKPMEHPTARQQAIYNTWLGIR